MIRDNIPRGSVITLSHESNLLKDNPLSDPYVRDVTVYLPAGYSESQESFPSIYVLSGFTGRGQMMLNDKAFEPTFAERMDRLIAARVIRPMLAVMPDCFTYYGGSQYINSTATGRYEDYLTQEIVPFVDANFRTIAAREARSVIGKSSGGYGSLIMGMRHADLFSMVCSIAGDSYFEYCYLSDLAKAFRVIKGDPQGFMEKIWATEKHVRDAHAAINTIGMAACYSPNGNHPELPFDIETGRIKPDVWKRWLEHDPVRLVEKYRDALCSLNLLFLDAGRNDEFNLDAGARILSNELNKYRVPHIHEEFDGGHFSVSYRFDRSLELVEAAISSSH